MEMKIIFGAVFFSTVALLPLNSSALTLSAENHNQKYYTGASIVPVSVSSLVDGDFTIIDHNTMSGIIGNGIDDRTSWMFDFRNDPDYPQAATLTGELTSALLTLELTPKNNLISTDYFRLDGLDLKFDLFTNLPLDVPCIFQLELIGIYTSAEIMSVYNNNFGMITAEYADDAYISYASLNLVPAPVPEPATMFLFGTGIVSLLGRRIIRKKK